MSTKPSSFVSLAQLQALPETPFKEALYQFARTLRVSAPGIVQSFDAVKQTVTVQLAIRENIKKLSTDNQGNLVPVAAPTAIPLLEDVPISLPRAGGYELTLPIQAGDECLVVFGDNCFNAWWANGGVQNQEEGRRHDLSDAIAVFGLWSQPRKLANYATGGAQLRSDDGTIVVEVGAGGLTLKANSVQLQVTPTQVLVTGDLVVTGTIHATGVATLTGGATISGKPFLLHEHTGVTTGGGITGGVV